MVRAALMAVLALSFSQVARAQNINEAVTIEDLGFTNRLHVGARPVAMAGAYQSIGDDAHALVYNPAGLARVRRVELGVGFQHQRFELDNVFYGNPSEVSKTGGNLDYLSLAYPFPTYRGSLVVAFGAYRVYSHDIDILNRGLNTTTSTFDDYRLQQEGSTYSYNFGFGVDLSPKVSVGANLFFMDGKVDALTQFEYSVVPTPNNPGDFETESLIDDARVDLDGYGAILGAQYHPFSLLHFGLSVSTPTKVNLKGDAFQSDVLYYVNSPDSLYEEAFLIDTDYTIPFRVDAGVSVSLSRYLVLSADIGYVDWTQAKINGLQLKDSDLQPVFREVVELRLGGEATIPFTPIRLRAGYASLPHPLPYLQADRISGDQITKNVNPVTGENITVIHERSLITMGVGLLIGKVLMLDAAIEYQLGDPVFWRDTGSEDPPSAADLGDGSRREIPTLADERKMRRLLLSASYRF